MAELKFYANIKDQNTGDGELINHAAGSGIGFYGSSFGVSVPIGSRQTTTYVTNSIGTNQGSQLNNTMWASSGNSVTPGTVRVNNTNIINLDNLPNYLCPLNIRFTHPTPVRVQNCKLRIFDRNNINNQASGVATYVYEARHPSTSQLVSSLSHRGRSPYSWYEFDPTDGQVDPMDFTSSPGASGKNTNSQDAGTSLGQMTTDGSQHQSMRHDWYVALSSEPITVGSKTQYGLYFTLEYL
ncbi:MAG: hypothetical protein EBX50_15490 [Chitinophagia bacterium]|nr:hypothetical protein [Chitinophagia bacterium]